MHLPEDLSASQGSVHGSEKPMLAREGGGLWLREQPGGLCCETDQASMQKTWKAVLREQAVITGDGGPQPECGDLSVKVMIIVIITKKFGD